MPKPPSVITEHAIDRYIERHRKGWARPDARRELIREASTASLHEVPTGADPIWITSSGRLLVVSIDGTVRTVLPMGSRATNRRPRRRRARR